jgi:hypothetical protein
MIITWIRWKKWCGLIPIVSLAVFRQRDGYTNFIEPRISQGVPLTFAVSMTKLTAGGLMTSIPEAIPLKSILLLFELNETRRQIRHRSDHRAGF